MTPAGRRNGVFARRHEGRTRSEAAGVGSAVYTRTFAFGSLISISNRGYRVNRGTRLFVCLLLSGCSGSIRSAAQSAPTKPLSIESLFQPGGLAGRGPETTEWSPDGSKLTFVQRDEKGEKGELWYVDTATGEKKLLVSAAKLAALDEDVNKVKNEREKERLTRYHVAAYLWAPDSKHLLFDSQGQ